MRAIFTFIFVAALLAFGALWLYLNKYATMADVFARERSYGIKVPLWMKEMPKTTGDIVDIYNEGRAAFSGEVEQRKTGAKQEFNAWLEKTKQEMAEKMKEEAKKKANDRIDNQFGSGK